MKKMTLNILILATALGFGACSKSNPGAATSGAGDTAKVSPFQTINYLNSISGKKTIAGIHNREPNATPARWTNEINATTGKYPALWSGDFLFQQDNINNRQLMIDEALREWKKGAVINIMWHACNPAYGAPCGWDDGQGVLSSLTDAQWTELCTDGSPLNTKYKNMVDEIATYLQQLKAQGVEVLWRPMHEMNQGKFWWGGRPGANGTVKLYQWLHNYLTNTKGLTNLIWVWDIQDFGSLSADAVNYNPGAAYYDIAALDVYDGSGYTQTKYETMLRAAKGKLIAIGECDRLPTAAELKTQSSWVFFMSWSELTFDKNTNGEIQQLYNADNIITLEKMPGWK
ncbi:glycoside hydrolase family 26 protein [Chitinophaga sp. Cy-1792]|uniref:glycoside hydrolase family 26 protein n=1 Tax=Chitinophaga sp. Cy-1792 TaxID=2608339 RepID=UPI00142389BF|nr:glycosyl hydrolase [Chitinophaga sp. Cy-1792]NIG56714.1 glycoside hydrolase [Chitinophaga sp. Cy-1792]